MSWSVSFIGKPGSIITKLDEFSGTLSGQSKAEFDDAKPYLQGLVGQIVSPGEGWGSLVNLAASGHASFTHGVKTNGVISVKIDPWFGTLALE